MDTLDAPLSVLRRTRAPRPIDEGRMQLLKAVADPTRLAILDRLACCGDKCHCDLEDELRVPANRMSFHLKVLREADLVVSNRVGKRVRYSLAPSALDRLHAALPVLVDPDDQPG